MSQYRLQIDTISRGKGHSITRRATYITGVHLYDLYAKKKHYHRRNDVLYRAMIFPRDVPHTYRNLQDLCNEIDRAEIRCDARTAREFIGSLPNELPLEDLKQITQDFIKQNFIDQGLCAIVAIHSGINEETPAKNNPHAHILISTRTIDQNGFSKKKDREHDKKAYMYTWREDWATEQNRAYERRGLDIRVSHEPLKAQGIDREPAVHLTLGDYQRELRGERTEAGNQKRAVEKRNKERTIERELMQNLELELEPECEPIIDIW